MGNCSSFRSSSSIKGIRVVHLNGYVEEFDCPVTVTELTGTPPKLFVATKVQLLSSSRPLRPETQLQPGHLYFLLPYSVFESHSTTIDMVSLVTRLSSAAKRSIPETKSSPQSSNISISTRSNSPGRNAYQVSETSEVFGGAIFMGQISSKGRSWKPLLTTINERSFNRRSESELVNLPSELETKIA